MPKLDEGSKIVSHLIQVRKPVHSPCSRHPCPPSWVVFAQTKCDYRQIDVSILRSRSKHAGREIEAGADADAEAEVTATKPLLEEKLYAEEGRGTSSPYVCVGPR